MNSVVAFPNFNLFSIPEALRKLANDIEADPDLAVRAIVVLEDANGDGNYRAFGRDPFPRSQAAGMCFAAAQLVTKP